MTAALRILFVDDEEHVLRGLRRALGDLGDQWDMTFCASGEEALETLDRNGGCDVVVSDMRMPGMDGADLLGEVRRRHPEVIRVILSGYADKAAVFRTVGPTHIYLAKPCDADSLIEAVQRLVDLKHLLPVPALRSALTGLNNLPGRQEIARLLEEELDSPHGTPQAAAELIARDVSMTAELLRLTNSAYFSVAGPASDPLQAVRTLGLETVRTLAREVGLFRPHAGGAARESLLRALAERGRVVADLAEMIAVSLGLGKTEIGAARCAAMLSRIGEAALPAAAPETALDAGDARIGAYLLGLWGFPAAVVEAVAFHAEPRLCPTPGNAVLTVLHAATALASGAEDGLDPSRLAAAGIGGDRIAGWRRSALDMARRNGDG